MRSLTPEELDWIIAWLGEIAEVMESDRAPNADIAAVWRVRELLKIRRRAQGANNVEVNA